MSLDDEDDDEELKIAPGMTEQVYMMCDDEDNEDDWFDWGDGPDKPTDKTNISEYTKRKWGDASDDVR